LYVFLSNGSFLIVSHLNHAFSELSAGGVIEPTRIMLAVSGEQYEDFRYPIDPAASALLLF
jgi:hypothetical protein